jgi:GTP cyclohydrolase II
VQQYRSLHHGRRLTALSASQLWNESLTRGVVFCVSNGGTHGNAQSCKHRQCFRASHPPDADPVSDCDANVTLGFADDEREYQIAARMLQLLGCHGVVLLTNSPAKLQGLSRAGVEICGSMPLQAPIKAENRRYLMTKAVRAGHRLDHLWTTGLNPSPARRVAAKGRKAAV